MKEKDKPPSRQEDSFLKKCITWFFFKIYNNQDKIIEILRTAEGKNLIDPDALIMIEGALAVSGIRVRDIMIPRIQMTCLHYGDEPKRILKKVLESGYSRFPVIGKDHNEIVGVLLAKDLLAYFAEEKDRDFDIKDMMRPATFVPESKRVNVLLRQFRLSRNHMAIVIDEYAGIAGLITIEDIIEEVIGEIEDEYDYEDEEKIYPHGRNRFIVKALTPIADFNAYFSVNLSDKEYDTVGGLIMSAFGRLPRRNEEIEYAGFKITVLQADKRKINLLRVTGRNSGE